MALTGCRECGQQVSTEAATCPHCGTPTPTGKAGRCLGCGKDIRVSPGEACPLCGVKDPLTPYRSSSAAPRSKPSQRRQILPWTLMIVGFGWGFLGMANIVAMFFQTRSSGLLLTGLIFNMLLFVLPGLAIGGIGLHVHRRD